MAWYKCNRFKCLAAIALTATSLVLAHSPAWSQASGGGGGGGTTTNNGCAPGFTHLFLGGCITNAIGQQFNEQLNAVLLGSETVEQFASWMQGMDIFDPYADVSTTRDNGAGVTSAAFGPLGTSATSRTTAVNSGLVGGYAPSYTWQTAANQSLRVGAYFNYGSSSTSYGMASVLPGFLNTASMHQDKYSFGGGAVYHAGDVYFGGLLGGSFGRASIVNMVTGGAGSFGTDGFSAMGQVGKVFTLAGDPGDPAPDSILPAKAPPKPASGYSLKLDVMGFGGYYTDRADGFTDSTGFTFGAQQLKTGFAGAQAKLYETWVLGDYVVTPYVSGMVTQELGYSNVLTVPAQAAAVADSISYGGAQTFYGASLGVGVNQSNGIMYGLSGYWQQSSEFQTFGGRAYIVFPIQQWVGLQRVRAKD